MRRPTFSESWPESWKTSYSYDLLEIYGETSHRGYTYAYANRRKTTLELVASVASPPARVLDVAAAQGNYSLSLAQAGYRVTWNDIRADLEDYVKLKYVKGDIAYAPGNVFELGFESEFDVVVMTEVIEHVAHPDQFLTKIARYVRPGGSIVMTTPNGRYVRYDLPKFSECDDPSRYEAIQFGPNADGHIFLLHRDELEHLAERSGLRIERVRLLNNVLTNGHVKTEYALRVLPKTIVDGIERFSQSLPANQSERLHSSFAVLFSKS